MRRDEAIDLKLSGGLKIGKAILGVAILAGLATCYGPPGMTLFGQCASPGGACDDIPGACCEGECYDGHCCAGPGQLCQGITQLGGPADAEACCDTGSTSEGALSCQSFGLSGDLCCFGTGGNGNVGPCCSGQMDNDGRCL